MVHWRLMNLQLGPRLLEPCVWRNHLLVLLILLNWEGSASTGLFSDDADDRVRTAGTRTGRLT